MIELRGRIRYVLLVWLMIAAPGALAAAQYSVRDLSGDRAGASTARALNRGGLVVGDTLEPGRSFPSAISFTEPTRSFQPLGGTFTAAFDIDSAGRVAGLSALDSNNSRFHAALFDGTTRDLGTLGGNLSIAYGINDRGETVGYAQTASGQFHAFIHDGAGMRDLGTLGGTFSVANDLNASGVVAGSSLLAGNSAIHAFRFSDGGMHDLGTLGGSMSYGHALNASGQTVGYSSLPGSSDYHAFLYTDSMVDLGTLGGVTSTALGLNDAGTIVGSSLTSSGEQHAFLYSGGIMHDLNALIVAQDTASPLVTLTEASDINGLGQIAATGLDLRTGRMHAYLLSPISEPSPVPLPAASLLLASGLAGLLGFRRVSRNGRIHGIPAPA